MITLLPRASAYLLARPHGAYSATEAKLAGHWASDPQYADKIARVANQVTGAA